jgi:hypothetical protein
MNSGVEGSCFPRFLLRDTSVVRGDASGARRLVLSQIMIEESIRG